MLVDIVKRCPNLAAFLGEDRLRGVAEREQRWDHPLRIICTWQDQAREQYLAALDRATELMEPIFQRSPSDGREKIAKGLLDRSSFDDFVAEIMCGARLERLGAMPIMEGLEGDPDDPKPRQPDYCCVLLGKKLFVEVYAPRAARDGLLDDIVYHLRDYDAHGSVVIDVSRLKREPKHAKVIAGCIKSVMSKLHESRHEVAIAYVPFGKTLECWITNLGETKLQWPKGQAPGFFARFHIDGTPGFRLNGVDCKSVDWKQDARRELRGLDQLQKGQTNVLVVDLTAKRVHQHMIDAYKERATDVFRRHAELSALLLVWRHFGLQPSPSTQREVRAGYVPVPSNNPNADRLSVEVLEALTKPGLILPGRPGYREQSA